MKTILDQVKFPPLLQSRQLDKAESNCLRSLDKAKKAQNITQEVFSLWYLSEIYRIKAAYKQSDSDRHLACNYASEAILRCKENANMQDDNPVYPELLLTYGLLHLDKKAYEVAKALFQQALEWSHNKDYLAGQNKAFVALSRLSLESNDFEKALAYAKSCAEPLEKNETPELWLNYYLRMGFVFGRRHQYVEMQGYFESALALSLELGDLEGEIVALQNIGVAYASRSAYKEAFQHFLISLEKGETIGFKTNNIKCLVNVGTLFALLNNFKEAEKRYLRILDQYKQQLDDNTRIVLLCNLGDLHFKQQHWEKAKHYLSLCLELAEKSNYRETIAQVLTQIGRLYCKRDDQCKALEYGTRAAELFEDLGDIHGKQINLVNLAWCYFEKGDLGKALNTALHGLELAEALSDQTVFADVYQLLSEIYSQKDNYEKAYYYQVALNETKEQLYQDGLDRKVIDLEIQAEIQAYRKQVQRLKAEESQNQEKIVQLKLQALHAQMNPHFIFNSLNAIQQFLSVNENESAMIFLARFSRLIRYTFEYSQRSKISLKEEIAFLELYLSLEELRFKEKIKIKLFVSPDLDQDNIKIPPLLVQPLVENAFKHGLLHRLSEGELSIRLELEEKRLKCTVEDNGVGRKKAAAFNGWKEKKGQSSLEITQNRLELLHQQGNFAPTFIPFKIIDLLDKEGEAAGTSVVFYLDI